jgi:hypothetical protein
VITLEIKCDLCEGFPDQVTDIVSDDDWKALTETEWNLTPVTVTVQIRYPLPAGWHVRDGLLACPRHPTTP